MSLETESEIAAVIATTKFCRDCKWHRPYGSDWRYDKCEAPQIPSPVVNLVTGGMIQPVAYCDLLRQITHEHRCGPNADWFVQADIRQAVTS